MLDVGLPLADRTNHPDDGAGVTAGGPDTTPGGPTPTPEGPTLTPGANTPGAPTPTPSGTIDKETPQPPFESTTVDDTVSHSSKIPW